MLRTIMGLIGGLAIGVLVTGALQALGHLLFPPPLWTKFSDPHAMRSIAAIPLGAKIAVLLAWMAGVFAGGSFAAYAIKARWAAWLIGGLFMAAGAWTMMLIPHPWWMWIGALAGTCGAAYAAGRFFGAPRAPAGIA